MTPFTDDDLRRFKEEADAIVEDRARPWIEASKLKALIARLEAAERMSEALWEGDISDEVLERANEAFRVWRKAAGK